MQMELFLSWEELVRIKKHIVKFIFWNNVS
jgi:hypothetical protein